MASLAVVMHRHHRRAWWTISAALVLDAGLGVAFGYADHVGPWNGLYWAEVTGTTTGYGDVTPRGWLPHVIACLVMATVIPLVTATFSLVTSGLTSQDVKDHVDQTISSLRETRYRNRVSSWVMRGAHAESLDTQIRRNNVSRHALHSDIRWRHAARPPRTLAELIAVLARLDLPVPLLIILAVLRDTRDERDKAAI